MMRGKRIDVDSMSLKPSVESLYAACLLTLTMGDKRCFSIFLSFQSLASLARRV
jgi:hypothetical protein